MGKKGIAALLACMFALCLALVGCGGNAEADAKKAFVGTWDLTELSQDGQETSTTDFETLKALGLEAYINLNEDGTAAFMIFGEVVEGSWEASSPTTGTLSLASTQEKANLTIDDSKLKLEQKGSSLTFQKGEAKSVSASSSSSGSTAASAGSSSAS